MNQVLVIDRFKLPILSSLYVEYLCVGLFNCMLFYATIKNFSLI